MFSRVAWALTVFFGLHGHEGFGEGADFFAADFGEGKEFAHFGGGEEADFLDLAAGAGGIGLGGHPAEAEAAVQGGAEGKREKLPAGKKEMRFEGKPAVGGLHKKRLCDALNFAGHRALVGEGADVFDDGIGEADGKRLVRELAEIAGVTGDGDGVGESLGGDGFQIEEGEVNGFWQRGGVAQPEAGGAADIENSHGCGEGREQREEVLHALAAQARGERSGVGVVGDARDHAAQGRGRGRRGKLKRPSSKLKGNSKVQGVRIRRK